MRRTFSVCAVGEVLCHGRLQRLMEMPDAVAF